jgi:hypothetical protein
VLKHFLDRIIDAVEISLFDAIRRHEVDRIAERPDEHAPLDKMPHQRRHQVRQMLLTLKRDGKIFSVSYLPRSTPTEGWQLAWRKGVNRSSCRI